MINIPVKISGLEKRRKSIGLLHIVAGFFLLANTSSTYKILAVNASWALALFFLLSAAMILYGILRNKIDPASRHNTIMRVVQVLAFVSLGLVWIYAGENAKSLGLFIWAGLSAMLAFTERIALAIPEVKFDDQGVSFPNGFAHKQIQWAEMDEVTLRTDYLTLHFPQNRFLQFELRHTPTANEIENLQDFCRRHLGHSVSGN